MAKPNGNQTKTWNECPVVGFGASAGGLEAFTEVLQHIPPDSSMAFVLVQHLDPKHASILRDLLARATTMPVVQVTDGTKIEPNHVYVIPPNTDMTMSAGALRLEPRPVAGQHMPIDLFFRSLALDQHGKAIGVILSGTASDGTLGLKAIKAEGGITFVQDPDSARYDGMPRSAIAAGCVDFILGPQDIAKELLALAKHPYLNQAAPPPPEPEQDEDAFKEIFSMLRNATGVDFSYYKMGTIQRRTQRRMALLKQGTVAEYARYIKENRGELSALFQDILINVTHFFRESSTFDAIRAQVLPALLKNRAVDDTVRIWVPGCSTGEEVYSIAIAALEYMREAGAEMPVQVFGTDLSESALEKARAGAYPESIAADVSSERLRRFFTKENGCYQISRSVRDCCIFARQNVTKDPPFSRLDLILCRNVLIYLGSVLQKNAMKLFHYALKPQGYLVLGQSETVGAASDLFAEAHKQAKIYTRKPASAVVGADFGAYDETAPRSAPAPERHLRVPALDGERKIDQMLLARYCPPAVVIDANLHVLQFRGQSSPYIQHLPGEASLEITRMTPSGLGLEIGKLVRRADMKKGPVTSDAIPIAVKTRIVNVRLTVSPLEVQGAPKHYVVVFEEERAAPPPAKGKAPGKSAEASRVRELEQELATTREYLQTVIEEQEAATEELKSAHEEVQSANEELQSTNEELLTAKEELQSTNEELTTVNEEMQSRNMELQQANNDLVNLLASVSIPILMLGNDLRIRRYTPQAEKLLNLLPTDVGRPISDFRLKINVPDLASLCQDVVDTLVAREREVVDSEGRIYTMWVRPYRTADNKIDGIVIALLDVTERKKSAEARYRRLFEAATDGILIADANTGEILDVNPFLLKMTGLAREKLIGAKYWDAVLFAHTPANQSLLERLRETESVETSLTLPGEAGQSLEAEMQATLYEETGRSVVQFNIRDVTARKRQEQKQRREEEQLKQAQKMEAVGRLAGGVAHDFNNLLTAILGYCELLEDVVANVGDGASDLVAHIRGAGERAAMLTKQLLAFGRKQVLQPALIDVRTVVEEMQQLMAVTLSKDVELALELEPELGLVKADRGQMEQAVLNLVLNARDAMPNGGRITVKAANVDVDADFSERHPAVPMGQYVALTVQDTGTGMDSETQAHIFEPFFTTKPKGKGSGLGLSTVYGIVKQCGGYIWAYSELGLGTTFTIYLPRVAAQEHAAAPAQAPAHETPGGTETVLLVEDEPAVRSIARRFLEQRGYRVLEAWDPREALRISREHDGPIHLLLTDVIMPHMSGREVAFQIDRQRPGTKVLYMSGHPEDVISDHGVLEDGVAFLQKPFTQAALTSKVREVLDRVE